MKCDDELVMNGSRMYRNFDRKYSKESLIRLISSVTEEHKHNKPYKSGVEYVDWTQLI